MTKNIMNKGFYVIYNIKILNYFSNKAKKKTLITESLNFIRYDEDVFHRLD